MPYNSITDRTDAGALIPEEYTHEIIQAVPQQSAVFQMARKLPNMSRKQHRLPILSALATAYFVDGDTGLKQTTDMAWKNKYINAEEIAAIVPIPEVVLDDVDYDLWTEIRPSVIEAIGLCVDKAILFGTGKPALWADGVLTQATAAGHTLAKGALGAGTDLYDEILGEGGINSLVEVDGYDVTGHMAPTILKSKLRGLRDTNGQPIFLRTPAGSTEGAVQGRSSYELDGSPIAFPKNGSMDAAVALDIAGDWSQLVYSIRTDLTWKILDQAVITDNNGVIIYNLPQQDMVALRVVMRCGWELPNPINRQATNDNTRFPFAVLTP